MARTGAVVRWHVERQQGGRWVLVAAMSKPDSYTEGAILTEFRRMFPLTSANGVFRARRV